MGNIAFPEFKLYYKITVIKMVFYENKYGYPDYWIIMKQPKIKIKLQIDGQSVTIGLGSWMEQGMLLQQMLLQ